MNLAKLFGSIGIAAALGIFAGVAIPLNQDSGRQSTLWESDVITTTAQTTVVACGQGVGSIGRKTLVVWNSPGSDGVITVTGELRDARLAPNFTSGHLAVNGLATDTLSSDTVTATAAGGRFCQFSATSASTSTITVTLRRE